MSDYIEREAARELMEQTLDNYWEILNALLGYGGQFTVKMNGGADDE